MAKPTTNSEQLLTVQKRVESIPPQMLEMEIQRNMLAVPQQPTNAALHFGIGLMMSRIGNQDGALQMLEQALKLSKNNEVILAAAAYVCASRIGDHTKALKYLQKRQSKDKNNGANLLLIANSQMETGKLDDALATLKQAERLVADKTRIHGMRSRIYVRQGNSELARKEYLAIAALEKSGIISVGDMLALLPDNTVEQMQELRAQLQTALKDTPGLFRDDTHRAMTYSALGVLNEKLGDREAAFAGFVQANAVQPDDKKAVGFEQTHEFHVLEKAFDRQFFNALPPGHASDKQVFVVGMPRSGTTLIESILAGHSKVEDFGELEFFQQQLFGLGIIDPTNETAPSRLKRVQDRLSKAPAETWHAIGEQYIRRYGFQNISEMFRVDKMPHNFRALGLIAAVFPQAKIIHATRHPMDICWSVFKNPLRGYHATFARDLATLGRYFIEYRKLMDHWRQVLPLEIHEVRYENLVAAPETQARALIDHIGLGWEAGCLDNRRSTKDVATASMWQVRDEIYSSSVQKWRQYERELKPLSDVLTDEIARYEAGTS